MDKNLIYFSKTPCRISLFGGGTDFERVINSGTPSNILSFTINKFVYSTIKSNHWSNVIYGQKYRINYYNSEEVNKINKIKNKIIREILNKYDQKNPFYISLFSDIPSGSGLGSSTAFIVGLLKGILKFSGQELTNKDLFYKTVEIERNAINKYCGLQDAAAICFGGINHFQFKKKKKIIVKNLSNQNYNLKLLDNNSYIIYSNQVRNSNSILKNYKYNKTDILNDLNKISLEGIKEFKKKKLDIKLFSQLIREGFELKKKLSNKIISPKINILLEHLNEMNINSYKVCGAGGGGFIYVFAKPNQIEKLKKKSKNIKVIPINIYKEKNKVEILK